MWKNFVKKIENCEVKWRDFNCRTVFRKIECLAFIPTSSVINGFKLIRDTASSYFHSFLDDYFEKYYIGSEVDVDVNGKNIKKRKVPSFPISLWSVYDRLIKNLPKTNNSIESWHKQFASSFKNHPLVDSLIMKFRTEQKETEKLFTQITIDGKHERNKNYIKKMSAPFHQANHHLLVNHHSSLLLNFEQICQSKDIQAKL